MIDPLDISTLLSLLLSLVLSLLPFGGWACRRAGSRSRAGGWGGGCCGGHTYSSYFLPVERLTGRVAGVKDY